MIYADKDAKILLLHPTDESEEKDAEKILLAVKEQVGAPVAYATFAVDDWNFDLSPWEAPPVFGKEPFGGGAKETLRRITESFIPEVIEKCSLTSDVQVVIGGYSLAALFALWSAYNTDRFSAVAAASPSVWFPDFREYAGVREPSAKYIYLSLGDAEEKTKNRVMAAVGDNIRAIYSDLAKKRPASLVWNAGGHFSDPSGRTADAFAECARRLS